MGWPIVAILYLSITKVAHIRWKLLKRGIDGEKEQTLPQNQLNHNLIKLHQSISETQGT
jgi:hypothetical protein